MFPLYKKFIITDGMHDHDDVTARVRDDTSHLTYLFKEVVAISKLNDTNYRQVLGLAFLSVKIFGTQRLPFHDDGEISPHVVR